MKNSLQVADLIWSTLNTIENSSKSRDEQINLIEQIVIKVANEQRNIGRNQILNNFQSQIESLKKL